VTIPYDRIRDAFRDRAWVYAESIDAVRIGRWDGKNKKLAFHDGGLDEDLLQVLRVFDGSRELRFSGGKCRDTEDYCGAGLIGALADVKCYYMYGYGEKDGIADGYTKLGEERGGYIFFPAELNLTRGKVALKLGVRNYVRYNRVPVCPKDECYGFGLGGGAAGALEVIDYAYTGFFYADEKEVGL